eukprot:5229918-Karenia_brevis.AAC.1
MAKTGAKRIRVDAKDIAWVKSLPSKLPDFYGTLVEPAPAFSVLSNKVVQDLMAKARTQISQQVHELPLIGKRSSGRPDKLMDNAVETLRQ